MKDPEFGVPPHELGSRENGRPRSGVGKTFNSLGVAAFLIVTLALVGFFATHCAHLIRPQREIISTSPVESYSAGHQLERRGADCNETDLVSGLTSQDVTPFLSGGAIAIVTQSADEADATSIPISTKTSTIYSVLSKPESTTQTETTTITTSLTIATEQPLCSVWNATLTVTVTVVPTQSYSLPPWASSSVLGDVTVTAGASTVTNINTDVSYTSGLPDVTISGNPSTVTDVQTDVSQTTGLPDVTASGNPSTITDVQTDVSLTSGLPDATISGNPSTVTADETNISLTAEPSTSFVTVVISDLWGPLTTSNAPTLVTVTAVSTIQTTVTTIETSASSPITTTITYTFPPSSSASSLGNGEATITEFVTTTNDQPVTATTTVLVPPPSASFNSSTSGIPSGTATGGNVTATPVVVISGGSRLAPEPRTKGFGNLGCIIILAAAIMLML